MRREKRAALAAKKQHFAPKKSERSLNTPLTAEQIKKLPKAFGHFEINKEGHLKYKQDFTGYTPTSVFPVTGQQMKQMEYRKGTPLHATNRKRTPGRILQQIPIFLRDEQGKLPVDAAGREVKKLISYKQVHHVDAGRLMNK